MPTSSMDSNPEEKRFEIEEIDRISNLPDSILGEILSHLSTKYAIATLILSTRWKNVVPFGIPVKLHLDDSSLLNPREDSSNSLSSSFMDFVDRLLNETLSDVPFVESMSLLCDKYNYCNAKVASWIRAAVLLNIRDLVLRLCLDDSKILFDSLNGCTTLSTLILWKGVRVRWCVRDDIRIPNLKYLHLDGVTFEDTVINLTNTHHLLLDACPALEYLALRYCNLRDMTPLYIQSPVLKILVIEYSLMNSRSELIVDCPNLTYLSYTDHIVIGKPPSIVKCPQKVHINVCPSKEQLYLLHNDEYDGIAKLVTACSSTINMSLSDRSMFALHLSFVPLPVFPNLRLLSLGCGEDHGWEILAHLLTNAPNLEKLAIKGFKRYKVGYANFQNSLSGLPVCLKLSMTSVEFWGFEGDADEIKLIEYFLKNGRVLQKLTIRPLSSNEMGIIEKLLSRHSESCQIVIKR